MLKAPLSKSIILLCPCSSEDRALASGARSAGSSPARGTIMVILLPYFESDRLKNDSVITFIDVEI